MSCKSLDETDCDKKYISCEWKESQNRCFPIRSSLALNMKREEQREAKGGWIRIMAFLLIALLVLFYAIQQAFGINTFDIFTGESTSANGSTYIIVFGTFIAVLAGLYLLLKKCDFSFSCFLLGGEAGMMEQPVEEAKYKKYTKDKLKEHFLKGGSATLYDGDRRGRINNRDEYDEELRDQYRRRREPESDRYSVEEEDDDRY